MAQEEIRKLIEAVCRKEPSLHIFHELLVDHHLKPKLAKRKAEIAQEMFGKK